MDFHDIIHLFVLAVNILHEQTTRLQLILVIDSNKKVLYYTIMTDEKVEI